MIIFMQFKQFTKIWMKYGVTYISFKKKMGNW